MADHAAASPSSAAMWISCPASITLAEGKERPASRYAEEGTAAHTIAEMILGGELFPPPKIQVGNNEYIVGLPMLRALNPYIDFVEKLRRDADEVFIEHRVKLSWSDGWVWGTTDCAAKTGSVLDVVDLKYGKGIQVSPESAQLKIYALAAADTLWPAYGFSSVNLTIIQPRMSPSPQTVTLEAATLWDWRDEVLKPAVARIIDGDETEQYGHWCRWCVRKNVCKAFAEHKATLAAESFDDGVDTLNI